MKEKFNCDNCKDFFWVCEDHHNVPFTGDNDCCGGAGMPCKECNDSDYENEPRMPEGFQVFANKNGVTN